MPHETVTYRRAQLYEEVWAEAVDIVAKRYGVSGVALGKMCRKLRVPLPGRGYWARKRAGQKLKRPPLAPMKKGEPEEISVSRWHEPERPKPILSPETEAMIEKEETPEAAIVVQATLEQPHKLVGMSSKPLQRAKPFNNAVHVRDHRCLDIHVSPAAVDRALRIMDALLKALDARELRVEVTDVRTEEPRRGYYERRESEVPSNVTRVKVSDEWIRFALTEKIAQKRPPPPPAPKNLRGHEAENWQYFRRPPVEYVPTGDFTLSILDLAHLSVQTSWRDGKRQRVEGCLNDFVSSLYVTADAIKAHRIEQARQRKQAEEEQKRRWEEQRRQEEEAKRAKELEEVVGHWRFAQDVRDYVAEARKMVADADLTMNVDSPFDKWLKFASSYAEKVDPLAGLRADIAKVLADKAAKTTEASSPRAGETAKCNETDDE